MKNSTTTYFRVLSAVLAFLGFSSCDKLAEGDEYGTPSARFRVIGTVVDAESGDPIAGIRTVLMRLDNQMGQQQNDLAYTDSEGVFRLRVLSWPDRDVDFILDIEDVDGLKNGLYKDKQVTARFRNARFEDGSGNWYAGEAILDMGRVELEPQEPEV